MASRSPKIQFITAKSPQAKSALFDYSFVCDASFSAVRYAALCAQSMKVPQMDDMPMSQPAADDALANMANAIDQPRSASSNSQSPTRSRSRRPMRKPEKQFPLLAVAGVMLALALPAVSTAETLMPPHAVAYVNTYCIDCHGKDTEEGEVNLERDSVDWKSVADRTFWEKVRTANHDKMMPPKKESQPREAERTQFSDWIAKELSETPIFGVTKARRLSRDGYRNTMRALFQQGGLKLPLGFPEDNEQHGFDNLSEGLVTSPDLLEAYSETAEAVADLFYPRKQSLDLQSTTHKAGPEDMAKSYSASSIDGDALRLVSRTNFKAFSGTWLDQFDAKVAGTYRIEIKTSAFNANRGNFMQGPMILHVRATESTTSPRAGYETFRLLKEIRVDSSTPKTVHFDADLYAGQTLLFHFKNAPIDFEADPLEAHLRERCKIDKRFHAVWNATFGPLATSHKSVVRGLGKGWQHFQKQMNDPRLDVSAAARDPETTAKIFRFFRNPPGAKDKLPFARRFYEFLAPDYFENGPALQLHAASVTGPLKLIPSRSEETAAKLKLNVFGIQAGKGSGEAMIEPFLRQFLPRAFRRPVSEETIATYMKIAEQSFSEGHDTDATMHLLLRKILISPRFLYRCYNGDQLDDYDLAARLSYFLTKQPPDARLLQLASQSQLRNPQILRTEAKRLMPTTYDAPMITSFVSQWLNVGDLDDIMPDPKFEFSALDTETAKRETFHFFCEILSKDLPISSFIDPAFTYTTPDFSHRIYGLGPKRKSIENINRLKLERIALPKGHRHGGILGQSAVMMATANGVDTQAVLRGAWVLENVLGMPTPGPPQDVPALTPDTRGATTPRELLAKHTTDAACASCHQRIDPLGFMLENYDPVGKWRQAWPATQKPIDASGVLFDGTRIQDAAAFKRWLVANIDYFGNCLSEKLLTYATGRVLNYSEKQEVKQLVTQSRLDGDGFKGLVLDLISSRTFMGNLYTARTAATAPIHTEDPKGDSEKKRPFRGHETFDQVQVDRFNKFDSKNSSIRDGVLFTQGSSGGKYPPMVGFPIDETDCTISFRYRFLGDSKMIWLFIDGDDSYGGQDHVLRVKLMRDAVGLQVDAHTKDPKHPQLLKNLANRRKQSPAKKDRPPDPVSGAYRVSEQLKPEPIHLRDNRWHTLSLAFKGDQVSIRIDDDRWSKNLTRPGFAFKKNMLLLLIAGSNEGIEIDDLKIISSATDDQSTTAKQLPVREGATPGNQKKKRNGPSPFGDVDLSQEQKVQVQELQKTIQPLMMEARASKDRKKIQAVGNKFHAGLAKILDEEQSKKYKEAMAKIREGANAQE